MLSFLKWHCRKQKNLTEKTKESKLERASMAKSSVSDDGESLLITMGMDQVNDSWIIDYGFSYHPYSNRDLFGGSVLMGNNTKLMSIGLRIVKMRMFDGIVQTLMM